MFKLKLLTYNHCGLEKLGVFHSGNVYCLESLGINFKDMNDLIENITDEQLKNIDNTVKTKNLEFIPFDKIKKIAPIPVPKQDVICLGINYMAHAKESANYKKESFSGEREYAVYFSKRVNQAVADGDCIPSHLDIVDSLDYEVELAVIIRKDAKNVTKENAFDYIFGYTIINDVSARNIQTRHKQWYFGKSLDGFLPMGPWIVTADELGKNFNLQIKSRVNGEIRQNSYTDLMIFKIDCVIEELSKAMTLKSGTVIAMGTPAGVGMGFSPPKFLKHGDTVECEIEKIGCIKNYID